MMPRKALAIKAPILIRQTIRLFLLFFSLILLQNASIPALTTTTNVTTIMSLKASTIEEVHLDEEEHPQKHLQPNGENIAGDLWSYTYGGANEEYGNVILECSNGGFAIVGRTESFGAGNFDVWLIRIDENGSFLWDNTYGGFSADHSYDMVECSNGGFAIVGWTDSFGAGNSDVWLIRTDVNGVLVWNQTYGGPSLDWGQAVIECNTGGFAIIGWTESFGAGHQDIWLLRTDENGNLLWNQTYGYTDEERGYSIFELSTGGFILFGRTKSMGLGGTEVWLVCTDVNGNIVWDQLHGGTDHERVYSIAECSAGGFIMTGRTSSFGAGQSDMWLFRIDENGNHLWIQTFGGSVIDNGMGVVECSGGGFVVIGETSSFSVGGRDMWLVRTDQDGHLLWAVTYGGTSNEIGYSIVEREGGGFIFIGYTESYGIGSKDLWLIHVPDNGIMPPPTLPTPIPTLPMQELLNFIMVVASIIIIIQLAVFVSLLWRRRLQKTNQMSTNLNQIHSKYNLER
jgi:hypothetical protein